MSITSLLATYGPNDPYFSQVVFQGLNDYRADGYASAFLDESTYERVVTPAGNVQYDTAAAPSPLPSSVLFDGTGDWLDLPSSTDFAFGTGDYTIEGYFRFDSPSAGGHLWDNRAGDSGTNIDISTNATNFIVFWSNANKINVATVSRGAWHHFAVCRVSGTTSLYLDGVGVGSAADSNNYTTAVAPRIGGGYDGLNGWNGWQAGVRCTKGRARYTGTFVVPPLPLWGPKKAFFSATPLITGVIPTSITFTDLSANGPTSWAWEKNDGSGWVNFAGSPTSQNPSESLGRGAWSIRLTATNAGGSQQRTRSSYVIVSESLLLHFNGTNGSTTFTDSSAYNHTPTVSGSTNISTTSPKLGSGAGLFNGTTDKLTWSHASAFTFTGDFTFEWFMKTTQTTRGFMWGNTTGGVQNFGIEINQVANNTICVAAGNSFTTIINKTSAGINDGNWHHIAITRSGSDVRLYIDGVHVGNATNSATWGDTGGKVVGSTFGGNFYNGRMDELRIINGYAAYTGTGSFTPPSAEF